MNLDELENRAIFGGAEGARGLPSGAWHFRNQEVLDLLRILFEWRDGAEGGGREVKLLCGSGGGSLGVSCGMSSTISLKAHAKGGPLEQVVAGPITDEPLAPKLPDTEKISRGEVKGDMGNLSFKHKLREKRNLALVEVTAERDAHGIVGSAVIRPVEDDERGPQQMEDERGRYQKMPWWWVETIPLDHAVFADDDIWLHAAIDEPLVAARDFIDDDPAFEQAIVEEYATSRLDDLARPKELRTINFADTALLERQCAASLVRLWRKLPTVHAAQLAHVPDKWVLRVLLTKALGEFETIKSVGEWSHFMRRSLSLAAILRKAALMRQRGAGVTDVDMPTVTEEEAAADAAAAEEEHTTTEKSFQDEMNWLAENNIEEYNKRLSEQKEHAQEKMERVSETVAQKRKRSAADRKELRIQARSAPLGVPAFSRWEKERRRAARQKKEKDKEASKKKKKEDRKKEKAKEQAEKDASRRPKKR